MRLGANNIGKCSSPEEWVKTLKKLGYSAAAYPFEDDVSGSLLEEYKQAAAENDILIAEVGAWNANIIHPKKAIREQAIEYVQYRLYTADKIGARCCVSVGGTLNPNNWAGSNIHNFRKETLYHMVDSIRKIIDSIQPEHTYYTIEAMPNTLPDSAETYLELIRAVNRRQFAVHFDPVNIISSPRRYCENGAVIRDFTNKLGQWICSCHAKDVHMSDQAVTHIFEVAPGKGFLDYKTYLRQIESINPDMPLLIEHLRTEEEFAAAAAYIRETADTVGVRIK